MPKKILAAVVLPLLLLAGSAFAGTDATFSSIVTVLTDWMEGTLGTLMAIAALAIGLGIGIARATAVPAVVGLAVALFATYGPGVVAGIATAVI
jgi:conjugal transfer pilus assembly protein TraA